MTYQEIWYKFEFEESDIFETYDLLNERISENNRKFTEIYNNENFDIYEKIKQDEICVNDENLKCEDLKSFIETTVFNKICEKLLNEKFGASRLIAVERNVFFHEKEKHLNSSDEDVRQQEKNAINAIKKCIGFLSKFEVMNFETALIESDLQECRDKIISENSNIAPELKDIISKLTKENLLVCGTFPTEEKTYFYKIKTSVKKFIEKLKILQITDSDSKRIIYNNICLPKEQSNAILEQVTWQTFRKYFY